MTVAVSPQELRQVSPSTQVPTAGRDDSLTVSHALLTESEREEHAEPHTCRLGLTVRVVGKLLLPALGI